LPGKVDADPEWRPNATFTTSEVTQLITDQRIYLPRRIQYALKALAGLRHGEVAGLRWRHYDDAVQPLGKLIIATSYDTGRTKTEVTRQVPVIQELAEVLKRWRSEWSRFYERERLTESLVVPTVNMTPIDPADAGHAMTADLQMLDLRVEAGKRRKRGGHDLRAWFITSCQEAGAHRDLLRVVTHTAKGDVMSGYTRATWSALCAEISKLQVPAIFGSLS
jgi:integrase